MSLLRGILHSVKKMMGSYFELTFTQLLSQAIFFIIIIFYYGLTASEWGVHVISNLPPAVLSLVRSPPLRAFQIQPYFRRISP